MRRAQISSLALAMLASTWLVVLWCAARPARSAEQPQTADRERLRRALANDDHLAVVETASALLEQDPSNAQLYYVRGRARYCLGQLPESLEDFDRVVKLAPDRERELWERGIVYYDLGRYREGARQFEQYQKYYDSDVENAVWRFLCQVHVEGLEQARRQLLPIERDRRVPMMEIYALFRGQGTRRQVLEAAAQPASPAELRTQQFFAQLYLGLYEEVAGDPQRSLEHLQHAVGDFDQHHYMWHVARMRLKHRTAAASR